MLHFDRTGELKGRFLITAVQRNNNPQLRLRALADIAALRDPDAFDTAIDIIGGWPREERKEATKIMLRALVERRIGRRDQANAWIWRLAEYTRDVHEEYAVQRWPETKRLLGLLVNSAGGAHARNARRLIHAARKQDRRLAAALLAAALAHTPEAEEALRGARTRMARKPPALARELLRNFPKRRAREHQRRRTARAARSCGTTAARSRAGPPRTDQVAARDRGAVRRHGNGAGHGTEPERRGRAGRAGLSSATPQGAREARWTSPAASVLRRRRPGRRSASRPVDPSAIPSAGSSRAGAGPQRSCVRAGRRARPGLEQLSGLGSGQSPLERLQSRPAAARHHAATASEGGGGRPELARQLSSSTATLRPIPSDRPLLLGTTLDRIPASFAEPRRASQQHDDVVRPLDACALAGANGPSCNAVATATAAPAAAARAPVGAHLPSRDISSELPAGADQLPALPAAAALCSAAVTSVPCGAPASASSRARALVELGQARGAARAPATRRGPDSSRRPRAAHRRARRPAGRADRATFTARASIRRPSW